MAGEVRPLPIVLDTNTVLDLLHFHDERAAPLAAGLASGRLVGLSDPGCLEELRRVLAYPRLGIPPERAAGLWSAYRDQVRLVPGTGSPVALPVCRDPDDQRFLELAARGEAAWLVSKDKLVLRLRHHRRCPPPFAILKPEEAAARLADLVPQSP